MRLVWYDSPPQHKKVVCCHRQQFIVNFWSEHKQTGEVDINGERGVKVGINASKTAETKIRLDGWTFGNQQGIEALLECRVGGVEGTMMTEAMRTTVSLSGSTWQSTSERDNGVQGVRVKRAVAATSAKATTMTTTTTTTISSGGGPLLRQHDHGYICASTLATTAVVRQQLQWHWTTRRIDMLGEPAGNVLQSSELVEVWGNDTHDGRGGGAEVPVATGYDNDNKAWCWIARGCNVESPIAALVATTKTKMKTTMTTTGVVRQQWARLRDGGVMLMWQVTDVTTTNASSQYHY